MENLSAMRFVALCLAAVGLTCALPFGAGAAGPRTSAPLAVGYASTADLLRAVGDGRADIVRVLPKLHVAEVRSHTADFAATALHMRGVDYVEHLVSRTPRSEPALFPTASSGMPYEWQFSATHEDAVPAAVSRAAGAVKIAVIDTGADLSAPDLSAKSPWTYNLSTGGPDVRDLNGHGTFVSSLAAGSVANGEGVAGFGGDAQLLVIKAVRDDGSLTDLDEASGIMYAVDHGARVINLSVGGPATSATEQRAVAYAAQHNVLIVAAVGNEYTMGNPRRRGVDRRRLAGVLLERGDSGLARRAGPRRLRRDLLTLFSRGISARVAARLDSRPLRLLVRHVVRDAGGCGGRSARLGGQPFPPFGRRGVDHQGHGERTRRLESGYRIRRARCSRSSRSRGRPERPCRARLALWGEVPFPVVRRRSCALPRLAQGRRRLDTRFGRQHHDDVLHRQGAP